MILKMMNETLLFVWFWLCLLTISFLPRSFGYVIPNSLLQRRLSILPISFHRNEFQQTYPNGISSSFIQQQQQQQLTLFTSNNDYNTVRHTRIDKMKKDEIEESHTTKGGKNNIADCHLVGSSGDRRTFFQSLGLASIILTTQKDPVNARGLVQVPCNYDLANTYHFLRAGQSLLEEEDILSTNPLFL